MRIRTVLGLTVIALLWGCGQIEAPAARAPANDPGAAAAATPAPATETSTAPRTPAPVVEASNLLERVVVIGASALSGFGAATMYEHATGRRTATFDFGQVVDAAIVPDHVEVVTKASPMFFLDPISMGRQAVDFAKAKEPTLVIGADFLFWFGYGNQTVDGQPLRAERERMELLEKGLAYLDELDCPIVVGDFPDMSAAVGLMLGASQMPRSDTLGQLNDRLDLWAAERDDVVVVPWSSFMEDIRTGKAVSVGSATLSAEQGAKLLLPDKLHPSADGLAAIALLFTTAAMDTLSGTDGQVRRTPDEILDQLRRDLAAR